MKKLADKLKIIGEVKWIKSRNGKVISESPWMKNQVVSGGGYGISILLDKLIGDFTYTGEISHADIGDDNTPATAGDTDLGNGLERASVGAVSTSGLTRTFRFFFADAVTANDTYEEFGMFIDGSASVGTGRIFNHLILSTPIVKSAGEDHTIVCRITGSV